jgi:hypothetical protein
LLKCSKNDYIRRQNSDPIKPLIKIQGLAEALLQGFAY